MKTGAAFFAFLLFMASFINTVPVCGATLEELLDFSAVSALRNGEKQSEVQFANSRPLLMPRHEGIRLMVENIRSSLGPTVIAETIQAYTKPGGQPAGTVWGSAEQTALFNAAAALSTLQGLQYFSASRGTMRTFYELSTVIDGPSTKRALPDPVYSYLPSGITLFARQKDLTFGDNVYQYEYHTFNDSLVFVQQNVTPMSAGIIRAVGRNNLQSVMAIIDTGDCLLLYAVSMAKVSSFPGMRDRMGSSFSNRADAVMNWVTAQADKVYLR